MNIVNLEPKIVEAWLQVWIIAAAHKEREIRSKNYSWIRIKVYAMNENTYEKEGYDDSCKFEG